MEHEEREMPVIEHFKRKKRVSETVERNEPVSVSILRSLKGGYDVTIYGGSAVSGGSAFSWVKVRNFLDFREAVKLAGELRRLFEIKENEKEEDVFRFWCIVLDGDSDQEKVRVLHVGGSKSPGPRGVAAMDLLKPHIAKYGKERVHLLEEIPLSVEIEIKVDDTQETYP